MATKEDQETLRLLVQYVSRAFYEPKYTIIMDQLARHAVLKDDELAGRMGLQPKELNKVIAVLSNDSLVKVYRQNELKEGAQRSVGKQYYYIDYEHFCNVVKWRVAKMRHIIDETLRNTLDNKGYICPRCKQSYTPLDADRLMDFAKGAMFCEICHAEVVDNEDAESVQGSKDRMQRFNSQMRFIREGLQKSESMVLPHFDVAAWIKNNATESDKSKTSATGPGLKIAGEGARKEDEGIGVLLAMDKDEMTQRLERDAQAEIKRQQNAMPSWHLKSTITGELTALGVKETAREVSALANGNDQTSNDSILKGLGVIGGSSVRPTGGQSSRVTVITATTQEDVKPVINAESDLYDQYYASLAAAASMSSGQPTPTATAMGSSSANSPIFSVFNPQLNDDDDDEEDRKPNMEYLDSLNAYRKRSRSTEDVGQPSRVKVTRLDIVNGNGYLNGYGSRNGSNGSLVESEPPQSQETLMSSQPQEADPVCYVAGAAKAYSQITDEDHELMTPEEYTAFFEVFQARSES